MCALIKTSGIVSEIRGSIGGTVYSRNRSGAYVRNRSIPVQPNTKRQVDARDRIRALVTQWNTLTQAQRDAWTTYAQNVAMTNKLGDTIYLTGQNHFVRANQPRLTIFRAAITTAPTTYDLGDTDPTLAIDVTNLATGTVDITFDDTKDWCDEADANLILYCGRPQNGSINYYVAPWRQTASLFGSTITPPTSPQTIPLTRSDYTWASGQKAWFAFRIQRGDGRLTEPLVKGPYICP